MGIINCKECGALCTEAPTKLCGRCYQDYLDAEIMVAEFLRAHEHSTIEEVHQATKVAKHIIMKMIQEGRLIQGKLAYPCESCGAAISFGRLCKNCETDLAAAVKPTVRENREEPGRDGGGLYIRRLLQKELTQY